MGKDERNEENKGVNDNDRTKYGVNKDEIDWSRTLKKRPFTMSK